MRRGESSNQITPLVRGRSKLNVPPGRCPKGAVPTVKDMRPLTLAAGRLLFGRRMESGTVEQVSAEQPAALAAATLCEAFQITAAERPDDVALRTPGDGVSITWREFAAARARHRRRAREPGRRSAATRSR